MRDIHPYEEFIPEGATKLIIGTIPPHRFCVKDGELMAEDVRFYYGSADNNFWQLIGNVFGQEFLKEPTAEAIEQRKSFLREQKIGITHIIYSCARVNDGASDKDLTDPTYRDIRQLLRANFYIKKLIYTSDFVKSCMCKALATYHRDAGPDRRRKILAVDDRKYDVQVLYSPSPQALRGMGEDGSNIRMAQYRRVFGGE